MMRMNIGYVYKIYENTNRAVFYGSTKQALSKRIYVHKSQYKLWCNKLTPTPISTITPCFIHPYPYPYRYPYPYPYRYPYRYHYPYPYP